MRYVSSTETQSKFASIMDIARREPVTIQKNGRDSIVVMAIEDYNKMKREMIKSFQSFCDTTSAEAKQKGLNEEIFNKLVNDEE